MKKLLAAVLSLVVALMSLCVVCSGENTDIFVEKVENLSDGFVMGADVSSLLALEESGVVYHDFEGNEADMLKVLADAGVNCVRVRVWNDPFDADGNGYGGGNCTLSTRSGKERHSTAWVCWWISTIQIFGRILPSSRYPRLGRECHWRSGNRQSMTTRRTASGSSKRPE